MQGVNIVELQPHIRLSSKDRAKYVIMPGDPKRVDHIASFLESSKKLAQNREYYSISGFYKGIKILAISTGIGGTSMGIAVEELKNIGAEVLIRVGSCGALQEGLKLGDIIIASGCVRNDGASAAYIEKSYPAIASPDVIFALLESAKKQDIPYKCGVVRSHDSFYTDEEESIDNYWSKKGILGADMESAALFVIGALRGLKTGSVLNVVVEKKGDLENGINEYVDGEKLTKEGEKREILTALEAIYFLESKKEDKF